jgi:hypothetical protein
MLQSLLLAVASLPIAIAVSAQPSNVTITPASVPDPGIVRTQDGSELTLEPEDQPIPPECIEEFERSNYCIGEAWVPTED